MSTGIRYDTGMMDAIAMWVLYGLHPGSCTSAIIEGDFELAYRCAHPHIKADGVEEFDRMCQFLREQIPDQYLVGVKNHKGVSETGFTETDEIEYLLGGRYRVLFHYLEQHGFKCIPEKLD